MSWEWSYTAEGTAAIYENIHRLPLKELLTIIREWDFCDRENADRNPRRFFLPMNRRCYQDNAADYVFERAEKHATCDDGAWRAWTCPYGCHTVTPDSFYR